MATEKQVQANRINAKQSTGPRTEEGKSRVSQNALKHGLCSRDAVIPGEDPADYEAQFAALEADVQPEGALECELVRQMADAQWRMQRLARLETAYLNAALDNQRNIKAALHPRPRHYSDEENTLMLGYGLMAGASNKLAQLARYDAHLSRRFERALQHVAKLRESREKRQAAKANQADTRPSNGIPLHPPAVPRPRIQPSEANCQAKPISTNHHEISELDAEIKNQAHCAPLSSPHTLPEFTPEPSLRSQNVAAARQITHPHRPPSKQN